jgi:hypothetical protein
LMLEAVFEDFPLCYVVDGTEYSQDLFSLSADDLPTAVDPPYLTVRSHYTVLEVKRTLLVKSSVYSRFEQMAIFRVKHLCRGLEGG